MSLLANSLSLVAITPPIRVRSCCPPGEVAVLERHASLNYANVDSFSDIDGMHFDSIESISIDWQ